MVTSIADHGEDVLQLATVTLIRVESVVTDKESGQVASIDCASKEFKAVIKVERDFTVLERGSTVGEGE